MDRENMERIERERFERERYDDEEELSLLDIFNIIWKRKFLIFFLTVLFGGGALAYALYTPLIYRAECRILPPQQSNSRLAGFATQLGGLADYVGLPGTATNGQMMIGILQGDSVVDAIIDRFSLMELYETDIRLNVRRSTLQNLEANEDTKSGIVSVAFMDHDPKLAADIANAFVEELQKKLQEISIGDAQQRRNFFESQLMQAQQELNEAEDAMINYQQSSGVVVFESQTQALLASIASLRNQIAAKNVEISSLSSYARQDNPRLRLARSQLDAMNKELRRLEEERQRADSGRRGVSRTTSSDLLSSIGQVPELGIEYQRYVRTLQFATAKYELMLRQYENARLSEASDLSTLFIVDKATVPDYKFKPKRAQIVLIGTMLGFCLGVFWAFFADHIKALRENQEEREAFDF